jgi:Carbonic anhydrase
MPNSSREALIAGYRRFRHERWPEAHAEYEALAAEGQRPHTLVIACSDSRADPALVFDAAPGELFVIRNVANLVPPYQPDGRLHGVSSALEFGVKVLEVERILVMGHAQCGGVNAMVNGTPDICNDFLGPWVEQGRERVRRVCEHVSADEVEVRTEEAIVRLSLDNLQTYPWISDRIADGRLAISGVHFGIANGILTSMRGPGAFEPVES